MLDNLIFSIAISTHLGMNDDFNNIHPHVQYRSENNYIAGVFYNSDSRGSIYVGKRYEYEGFVIEAGLVHGYKRMDVAPMIKVNYNGWYVAPGATETDIGIVTGYELRF